MYELRRCTMSEVLAIILLFVLVFGGAIGCGIKALFGIKQRKHSN